MEVINLELSKKLSRRKLKKGQSSKMYQKRHNCTVYDLKDNHKNAYCSYDALNLNELKEIAAYFYLSFSFAEIENVNDYAEKLIKLLKSNKINLENVKI